MMTVIQKNRNHFYEYILFTYTHNQRKGIRETFEIVFNFENRPKFWVWLDEGSNDGTVEEIEQCIREYGITMPTVLIRGFTKEQYDMFDRGNLMNLAFDVFKLKEMTFEFAAFINVGDDVPKNYFTRIGDGYYLNEELSMISGAYKKGLSWKYALMTFRWWTVKQIKRFWHYDPRMQMAHNAYMLGPKIEVLSKEFGVITNDTVSFKRSYIESWQDGKFYRYVGYGIHRVIAETLYRALRRYSAKAFIAGYWQNRGYECSIPEMKAQYRPFYKRIWDGTINILRKGVNKIDLVISNYKRE